ncbi:Transmembrane channel-like protein 2 [Dissostichus eleginoides]|uniref:Transmembrane channel-like protein 2 n=1 Tax=Dissostichus eleginoides TaxID=100907 RepID=A0AAD9B5T8_DISEL|nr:Transmembrane channel-like protein 2 [Dissostichus eleginoides]
MDLDPAIIIPALLFTAVAIYFASSYLNKKPDASAAAKKKPKVGYGETSLRPEPWDNRPDPSLLRSK